MMRAEEAEKKVQELRSDVSMFNIVSFCCCMLDHIDNIISSVINNAFCIFSVK